MSNVGKIKMLGESIFKWEFPIKLAIGQIGYTENVQLTCLLKNKFQCQDSHVKSENFLNCITKNTPLPCDCSKGSLQRCPQASVSGL